MANVKASPEAQLRLLDLAEIDAELARLDHRQRNLPEHQELARLGERERALDDEIAGLEARGGDLRREQLKAEADVDQVRSRIVRDQQRLDVGQVSSPKDLANLQSEIGSLHRRQSELEDVVLDVMERLDSAQSRRAVATGELAAVRTEVEQVTARREASLADAREQAAKAAARRAAIVEQEPADLVALYERLRAQHGGIGAAELHRGRCEGCHLTLNRVELNAIRVAAPDEVVQCEECRRILVRTANSGL